VTDAAAPPSPPRGRRLGRVALRVVVAAMVAMWVYVLYLAFGPGRQPPPDRLDDPAFAVAAQERCEAALDDVAELPRAVEAASPEARSEIVDQANERFAAMLDDLEAATPAGEDGELVSLWLADWRTYLGDRQDYADALLVDPDARLLVTARDREQITEYLDAFAADNDMPACATPIDV
jgi:hypothetical protein